MRTPQSPAGTDQAESTRLRLTFLTLLVVSLFILLFARLWFLQVMAGERYSEMAQGNAIRTISIDAPRGKILDRNGRPVVRNRYANVISVKPAEMGEREAEVMADVAGLLGITVDELYERVRRSRVSPFRPKPVAVDVPGDIRDYIHENAATRFPGVYAETRPLREYPNGSLAAHVVGYLGEISAEDLEDARYEGYRAGEIIGRTGVEQVHQQALRGVEGQRRYVVNARGRVIGSLEELLPKPGADVQLTLDLEAQRFTEEALARGIEVARKVRDVATGPGRGGTFKAPAGAALVLDPRNGEVLALASFPTYEPSQFVGRLSPEYWAWLKAPENHQPFLNRAVQSAYPPGSVFKPVSTAAALEAGYISTTTRLPCPRRWEWNGNVFRNWRGRDMPSMNLAEALVDSCDTVYYELARRMWTDEVRAIEAGEEAYEHLSEQARGWGFGAPHGIDLPSEAKGRVPGRRWKQEYWDAHKDTYCTQARQHPEGSYPQRLFTDLCNDGNRWRGGDAVNMSIGQGDLLTTPLQVANAFAAIANRGTLWKPHVTKAVLHPDGRVDETQPEKLGELPVRREYLDYIDSGLQGVMAEGGTAGSVFADFPVRLAGKTGTAEMKPKQPFAWFAAYG
ncbi:MAG TPA: penicillin-binding protein 2, partial [Egibacteraceae bacterium]|nr:penicillin-binding protein 2 [Egibacteraceae bacterium]